MEIKSGRKTYTLTNKDRIMFNGAVYLLLTQKAFDGWRSYNPTLPKTRVEKLIKSGELVMCSEKYKGDFGVYDLYKINV